MMSRSCTVVFGLLLCAAPAFAQSVWTEVGDAGDLPATAQMTNCTSTLDEIRGSCPAGDVDLFLILITNPAQFSATTCGGTNDDSKLMLFDLDGNGVTYDDDDPNMCGTGAQSTLTGAFVDVADQYYLAVCRYPGQPRNAGGLQIWENQPYATERVPDGPGAPGPVAAWGSLSTSAFDYIIYLTGTECSGTVATEVTAWGAIKTLYR